MPDLCPYYPSMPLHEGQTLAGYRVVRLLGSGGMGEVYLAEHPRLPRRDALKVLPADVSADPEYRARFHREADLAAKLWHPHMLRHTKLRSLAQTTKRPPLTQPITPPRRPTPKKHLRSRRMNSMFSLHKGTPPLTSSTRGGARTSSGT
jgi:serine/threonine protein kinase